MDHNCFLNHYCELLFLANLKTRIRAHPDVYKCNDQAELFEQGDQATQRKGFFIFEFRKLLFFN